MSCNKNLTIICETSNCVVCRFCVEIFNENNEIIYTDKINSFEYLCLKICESGLYKIKVTPDKKYSPRCAYRWVEVKVNCNNFQFFKFKAYHKCSKNCKTNFCICDHYYKNMPIIKGELILWRKTFQ